MDVKEEVLEVISRWNSRQFFFYSFVEKEKGYASMEVKAPRKKASCPCCHLT
jgi:hypothetical protein